ncbi:MAG: hypothetical protein ABR579_07010 [Actinomycetota bacterium]
MAEQPEKQRSSLAGLIPEKPASKSTQSMGRWINNLLGDKKARDRAGLLRQERLRLWAEIEYQGDAAE